MHHRAIHEHIPSPPRKPATLHRSAGNTAGTVGAAQRARRPGPWPAEPRPRPETAGVARSAGPHHPVRKVRQNRRVRAGRGRIRAEQTRMGRTRMHVTRWRRRADGWRAISVPLTPVDSGTARLLTARWTASSSSRSRLITALCKQWVSGLSPLSSTRQNVTFTKRCDDAVPAACLIGSQGRVRPSSPFRA